MRLVKLVRDRVEQHLGDTTVVYAPLQGPELIREGLLKKLIEEAAEYVVDPSPEELADVLEVVEQIAARFEGGMGAIRRAQKQKRREVGGLDRGMGMFVVLNDDARNHRSKGASK
jgi:predicted house-cleaning noncanonical NTP pyrophosphatase (MazG superfamily)